MAYGIPVTASDMQDPARLLGSDAIEVYSVLLFRYGVLASWAAVLILRVQRLGFWLMTVMGAIAQWAVLYGLVFQGRLSGANAYADLILYGCAVGFGGLGVWRGRPSPALMKTEPLARD